MLLGGSLPWLFSLDTLLIFRASRDYLGPPRKKSGSYILSFLKLTALLKGAAETVPASHSGISANKVAGFMTNASCDITPPAGARRKAGSGGVERERRGEERREENREGRGADVRRTVWRRRATGSQSGRRRQTFCWVAALIPLPQLTWGRGGVEKATGGHPSCDAHLCPQPRRQRSRRKRSEGGWWGGVRLA